MALQENNQQRGGVTSYSHHLDVDYVSSNSRFLFLLYHSD